MPMFNRLQHGIRQLGQNLLPCQLCECSPRLKPYVLCQDCWQQLPWFKQSVERQQQQIMAACLYEYPVDRILQQFKYEQKLHHQPLLDQLLAQLKFPKVQAIVPMPISQARLIERGYNQSLLLAQQLACHLKVPVWQPIRRLQQHSQKGLSRLERIEGIEHQFVIQEKPNICYRKVLIVDDVVTTGSSIFALSQVLKQLGCQQVYACCIAAAMHKSNLAV